MTGPRQKAIGYVRVSTSDQELSPEAQRDTIKRWASLNGVNVTHVFSDVCSGATPWMERAGLSAAVAELKRQGAAWLVVAKEDRLSRDLYNTLHLQRELADAEVPAETISCTENPEDTATPERVLMRQMLVSFAQFERAQIRGRIKAALDVRKAQGMRLGAIPLEGTELGRCIIWAMWVLHDQGLAPERVAVRMNELGIVGPRGGKQHYKNVYRVLHRPRPTVMPRAWRGITKTWDSFYDRSKHRESSARNSGNSNKTGRPAKSSGAESCDQSAVAAAANSNAGGPDYSQE